MTRPYAPDEVFVGLLHARVTVLWWLLVAVLAVGGLLLGALDGGTIMLLVFLLVFSDQALDDWFRLGVGPLRRLS